ncbi:MAG: hypothetical protein ACFE9L_09050 [Candidatus Hodarchaeota archaeon]
MTDVDFRILKLMEEVEPKSEISANKFTGSLFAEIIRDSLKKEEFRVSNRNVFLRGIDSEIDLLIHRQGSKPDFELLYHPEDVQAILELKKEGSFPNTIQQVIGLFQKIHIKYPHIKCIYLTLTERLSYKYRVTEELIGFPVYQLFPRSKGNFSYTKFTEGYGLWNKIIEYLKSE